MARLFPHTPVSWQPCFCNTGQGVVKLTAKASPMPARTAVSGHRSRPTFSRPAVRVLLFAWYPRDAFASTKRKSISMSARFVYLHFERVDGSDGRGVLRGTMHENSGTSDDHLAWQLLSTSSPVQRRTLAGVQTELSDQSAKCFRHSDTARAFPDGDN